MMEVQGGIRSAAGNLATSVVPAPTDNAFNDAARTVSQWTAVGFLCAVSLGLVVVCLWNSIASIFKSGTSWSMLLSGLVVLCVVLVGATVNACVKALSHVNTGTPLDYLFKLVVLAVLLFGASLGVFFGRKVEVPARY